MSTILVVDDDTCVRKTCQAILESAGHRVLAAGDAGEALRLAGQHTG
jgi:CheY-like chemotaxis protein